ncbi:VOC family protein [Microtetraspora sp. NBRC 13810]|uniref:VOC family protein n=1 Tax=Microtetraspora sp. NBRC 13810 TaxID=3030990 RepID=UPI0033213623
MYVTIYVTDQDRALKFYTEGLGLESGSTSRGPTGGSSPSAFPTARCRSSCGRMRRPRDSRARWAGRPRPVR